MFDENFVYSSTRLTIRFYTQGDYLKWKDLFSEMKTKQNQWDWEIEEKKALTRQRFKQKLQRHYKERTLGECFYFCVEDKITKNLIGICLISNVSRESAEIGFQLSNKWWGKGYGKEVAKAITEISFSVIKPKKVVAVVNKNNLASLNILLKLGFDKKEELENSRIRLEKLCLDSSFHSE